ncbi:MAG TPA: flavodoxin family protein [Candidatus Nanoarchaeia archaeon]|nr:flavodoxin family protein [Candidatus Nanoarchaeia archaeon]
MAKLNDQKLIKELKIDQKTLHRFRQIRAETIKEAKRLSVPHKKINVLGISGSARSKDDMAQEDSNSERLLIAGLEHCKKIGADVELVKLREYKIEYCKACYSTANTQCHFYCSCYPKGTPTGDDMSNFLYDKILGADAIIFATPVNNFKMSSLMTLFIDRCISLDGSLKPANPDFTKDRELNIKHTKFVEMNADRNIPGSGFLRRFTGKVAGIIVTGHEEGAALVISSLFMALNHFGMIFPPMSSVYAMTTIKNPTYADKDILKDGIYLEEVEDLAENIMSMTGLASKFGKQNWRYDYSSN